MSPFYFWIVNYQRLTGQSWAFISFYPNSLIAGKTSQNMRKYVMPNEDTKIKAEEERERMSPEEWEERQAKSMKVHNRQFPSTVSVKPWRVESLDERIEGNPEFLENAVSFQVYQSGGGGTNWIIEDFKDGIVEDGVPESVVDAVADRAKSMLDDMKAESLAGWVRLLKACNAGRTGKDVRNRVT